ncbi:Unknown protein sequence [Pseudomonas amygdali pv. lachrymans]|nr:Unknown protein sequence [Pseudomonas amygdali pv. lachrymans]
MGSNVGDSISKFEVQLLLKGWIAAHLHEFHHDIGVHE